MMKFFRNYDVLREEAGDGDAGGGPSLLPDEGAGANAPTGDEGAGNWRDTIDEEFRNDPSLASIQDLNGLAKSYVHAQKLVGRDKVVIPDEYASEEDINNFYNKLGRPERDKYAVDFGEAEFDEDFKKSFMDMAHSQGLMPKQAKEMFNFWNEQINDADESFTKDSDAQVAQEIQALKEEWGTGYDKQLATAKQAVETLVSPEFKDYLAKSGLGNNPTMIKMFAEIGGKLNEDTFARDSVKHLGMTKEEAQDKKDSMMDNMEGAYWNKDHAGHNKAVTDMLKINEILAS